MGFVGFQIANALVFLLNCWDSILPALSKSSLCFSIGSMLVITITVLAASPAKQSGEYVYLVFCSTISACF